MKNYDAEAQWAALSFASAVEKCRQAKAESWDREKRQFWASSARFWKQRMKYWFSRSTREEMLR